MHIFINKMNRQREDVELTEIVASSNRKDIPENKNFLRASYIEQIRKCYIFCLNFHGQPSDINATCLKDVK